MSDPPFDLVFPSDPFSDMAEQTVVEYARRLAVWVELHDFPRSMRAVAEKLQHRVVSAPLPSGTRGLRMDLPQPLILTSDRETKAAQERTVAHELFHPFIGVSRCRSAETRLTPEQSRIEDLCEIGAAELHTPTAEVRRALTTEPKIGDIPRLGEYFGSSLAATLRAVVAATNTALAGIVFEYRNKPRDKIVSASGQQVLFGKPEDYDPPKQLRIHDWSVAKGASARFNVDKHIDEGTSVFAAYSASRAIVGFDNLTSIGLPHGVYRTESWSHKYLDTRRVLTLVWLDPVEEPLHLREPITQ